jgi:Concanavalin A-like lectin/glucanases superfamily/Glycine rich protein
MPSHRFDGVSQIEAVARTWNGAQWTDDNDNLYAWDGAVWQLIQPVVGDLLPVEDLAAGTITDRSAQITWTNPVQPVYEPTEVWIDIPDITVGVWLVYEYPETVFELAALDGDTPYQVRVKLVRRVDGIVEQESPVRSVFFTTDTETRPVTAEDPGGSGLDTRFNFPLGSGGGCTWSWVLKRSTDGGLTFATTVTSGSGLAFDVGELDLPASTFTGFEDILHVLCITDSCTLVEACGTPFYPTDWGEVCDPYPGQLQLNKPIFSDAALEFFIPKICKPSRIEDAVSGIELSRGPAYNSQSTSTGEGAWVTSGASAGYLLTGSLPNIAGITNAVTLVARVKLSASPLTPSTIAINGINVAELRANRVSASKWKASGYVITENEGGMAVLGATELDLDVWYDVGMRYDGTDTVSIFVNGVEDGTETLSGAGDLRPHGNGWYCRAAAGMSITDMAGFSRELTPTEMGAVAERHAYTFRTFEIPEHDTNGALRNTQYDLASFVPDHVGGLTWSLTGASGGGSTPGKGRKITFDLELVEDTEVRISLGGVTGSRLASLNGGGAGVDGSNDGYSGGGYTAMQLSPFGGVADMVVIAGGGGGGGFGSNGGDAGPVGGNGENGQQGATGGTQIAGGVGQVSPAGDGSQLQGGTGTGGSAPYSGNGGGGGYYGGGSTSEGAGGFPQNGAAGGSSFSDGTATILTDVATATAQSGLFTLATYQRDSKATATQLLDGPQTLWQFNEFGPPLVYNRGLLGSSGDLNSLGAGSQMLPGDKYRKVANNNDRFIQHRDIPTGGSIPRFRVITPAGIVFPTPATTLANPWVVEAWFYVAAFPMTRLSGIVNQNNGLSNARISLAVGSTGVVSFGNSSFSGGSLLSGVVSGGAWHHVVGRVQANRNCELYVDGTLVASTTMTTAGLAAGTETTTGMHWDGSTFRAAEMAIANVAIYTTDWVTPAKLAAHAAAFDLA